MPKAGEDMTGAQVIVPALEKVVELRGTLDRPVQNIRFEGISFEHGSWLRPSKVGFVDTQGTIVFYWNSKPSELAWPYDEKYIKMPANVVCHAARSIRFERCTFARLGSAGIDIEFGSQNNVISGCHFYDIAGSAVQVGNVLKEDHHPDDPRKIVKNNSVVNCYIHDCGKDYWGGVGVFAGYTEGTVIAHNEIARLPYSGISVGWGWGMVDAGGGWEEYDPPIKYDTPTPAKNNLIEYNHVHHVMTSLRDGGGIYMLGNMPGTVVRGNHVHNDGPGGAGGIYLDEGSGFIEVTGNLAYDVGKPMLYNNRNQDRIATCNEHDNFFGDEYAGDAAEMPEAAKKVIESAGLE